MFQLRFFVEIEIESDNANRICTLYSLKRRKVEFRKPKHSHVNFNFYHSVEHCKTFVRTLIDRTSSFSMFKKDRQKEMQHIIKENQRKNVFFVLKKTKKISQQRERELPNGTVHSYIYISLKNLGATFLSKPSRKFVILHILRLVKGCSHPSNETRHKGA